MARVLGLNSLSGLLCQDSIFRSVNFYVNHRKMGLSNEKITDELKIFVPWSSQYSPFPGVPRLNLTFKVEIVHMAVFPMSNCREKIGVHCS